MARKRKYYPSSNDENTIDAKVQLWLLRLLISLGCHNRFIGEEHYTDYDIATLFHLPVSVPFDAGRAYNQLATLHQEAEINITSYTLPYPLANNIAQLAEIIELSDVERELLIFTIFLQNNFLLNNACDWLGSELNPLRFYRNLSVLLAIPENEVKAALSSEAVLIQTGLIKIDRSYKNCLSSKLEPLSTEFSVRLLSDIGSPIDWLRDMILVSPPPQLTLSNYSHLKKDLDLLLPYLERCVRDRKKGVNIFIYGTPGTGKTQLTRLLAQHLNRPIYEVSCEDSDGDSVNGEQRLCTIRAAQYFLKNTTSLLLFDEVEDVFGNNHFSQGRFQAQTRKAWVNHLLEENAVPTFWLCNDIDNVDSAFIRRFDWVLEMPIPPRKERENIIRHHCSDLLDESAIKNLATCEDLAPAVLTRAMGVMNTLKEDFSPSILSEGLHQLMNNTLVAQGHRGIFNHNANALPACYDPDLINCDADLSFIAQGLKEYGSARMCLFGQPGTGKSAYARWLAEFLNKPLHVKRGADLLSMWVGGTEKNISNIFREAQQEKAVLLIDEVDSFLQDRDRSQHSWEITAVNEMLTCMESYDGVFIASTNRLDDLDAASLRRFDLKVKFDALKPEQAWLLLQRYCQMLGIASPNESVKSRLKQLDMLTPGDFSVLARQHRFRPITHVDAVIDVLQAECAVKKSTKSNPIGFI